MKILARIERKSVPKEIRHKKNLLLFTLIFLPQIICAQLDSVHYMPPLHSAFGAIPEQYLYLSTPETTPFVVEVTDGDENLLFAPTISNGNPAVLFVGNTLNTEILLDEDSLGVVLSSRGLIASGDSKFYCNLRTSMASQAVSISCKGEQARGTFFRVGGIPQVALDDTYKNHLVSFMAMEDNTTIEVSDYDPSVVFSNPTANITANSLTITLDKYETYLLEVSHSNNTNLTSANGLLGALVISDNDIVLVNGNMCGGMTSSGGQDYHLCQPVPATKTGDEFVVIRGNGTNAMEVPIVFGLVDGTDIFVNGVSGSIGSVDAGDYFIIPSTYYSGTLHENMFISTSSNVYLYQAIAGAIGEQTGGLNFIPPVSCFAPNFVDEIPSINSIGAISYTADLFCLTIAGSTLLVNGAAPSAASGPEAVTGNSNWETYRIPNISGDVEIISDGSLIVGVFGASGVAGYVGYYSGFDQRPEISISGALYSPTWNGYCIDTGTILLATNSTIYTYQWLLDLNTISGANVSAYTPLVPGNYSVAVDYGASCLDTSNTILMIDCNILPIEIVDFNVSCEEDFVQFDWSTASEREVDRFIIQGSNDLQHWEEVASKKAVGNSTVLLDYSVSADRGQFKYFQLVSFDLNGGSDQSEIVTSVCDKNGLNVYPTITNDKLFVTVEHDYLLNKEMYVFDAHGKRLMSLTVNNPSMEIDVTNLANGLYQLRIEDLHYKFIKR